MNVKRIARILLASGIGVLLMPPQLATAQDENCGNLWNYTKHNEGGSDDLAHDGLGTAQYPYTLTGTAHLNHSHYHSGMVDGSWVHGHAAPNDHYVCGT
jgi:hypothetical protein